MKGEMRRGLIDSIGKSPEEKIVLNNSLQFLIDTNYVAMIDGGKDDIECREMLASFLSEKGIQ